jgi:hypothetical protein
MTRRAPRSALALALLLAACSAKDDGNAGGQRAPDADGGSAGSGASAGTGSFGNPMEGVIGGTGAVVLDAGAIPIDGGSCNQDVDIVFVLDVSGSMIPPLTRLEAEVDKVEQALATKNLPGPPHYGLVIFVDDVVVLNGGAPYPDVTALRAAITSEIATTNLNPARQAGPTGPINLDWPENSLDGLYAAATEFSWRDAASTLRTIIHVTDASFRDLTNVSSKAGDPMNLEGGTAALTSMHSYDDTIAKLREQSIWVNTFAAKTGGPPGATPSPPSHGAFRGVDVNVGIGFFEPYDGRNSIAVSTGGLSWDIDEVYDGVISLATPINEAVEDRQCVTYPPPPPPPE